MLLNRFGILYLFFAVFITFSSVARTIFFFKVLPELELTPWLLVKIYSVGLFFDVVAMLYFSIPFVLYLIFMPDKFYQSKIHRPFIYLSSFITLYILFFSSFAEFFFFEEFGVRFNFIAVDYLIYTHEVFKNIMESYPIPAILTVIAVISLIIFLSFKKWIDASINIKSTLMLRIQKGGAFLILPVLFYLSVDLSMSKISHNSYANELAANGMYSLFAAFRNNDINYETFYATRDNSKIFQDLRTLLREDNNSFVKDESFDITRKIKNTGKEKKLNVIVMVEESLSSEFLGILGNRNHLTPNLDELADKGIFFRNIYATGTRTDRGLEAITLSIPPSPGRSLLKRPNNEHLFSWGLVMKNKGYYTQFIYGGYGYFDNMDYFFSHNGFDDIVDRTDFAKSEITFENAWGVCDEDLFHKSIKEFNKAYETNRPFFALIMTTSNHRPYTYPDGKIDIPSHSGRNGAVKYADYAIGQFIRDTQREPWVKDTVFIIVADHCAGSAGKISLPVKQYKIPLLIYSPDNFAPQMIDRLASQIDIAPTVMGLLNFSYETKFFGKDILRMKHNDERAFIGTYETLGYIKEDKLVALNVKKNTIFYQISPVTGEAIKISPDQKLIDEAIDYYQASNHLFEYNISRFH